MKYESMNIERYLLKIVENSLFNGKIVIIYGARQVGKTTMCQEILKKSKNGKYINCELMQNKAALETTNDKKLKDFLGSSDLVILDEAQKIKDIGDHTEYSWTKHITWQLEKDGILSLALL